jgi:hypothetical protein
MGVLAKSAVATAVALLLAAGTAFAQNPTEQGYSSPGGTVQQQITSTPAPTAQVSPTPSKPTPTKPVAVVKPAAKAKSSGKGLPFTGLELGLVLAAGVALLGLGFGLRKFSRPNEAS